MSFESEARRKPRAVINGGPEMCRAVFPPQTYARILELVEAPLGLPTQKWTEDTLAEAAKGCSIIITTWGAQQITEKVAAACPELELIVHGAGSLQNMLCPTIMERAPKITTAVRINAEPVAIYTLGLVLTTLRDSFLWKQRLIEKGPGSWWPDRAAFVGGYKGAKIGLIGFGSIARRVLELLRPFGFDYYVCSDAFPESVIEAEGAKKVSLEWLMANCDVVSLHEANTPANRHMINASNISLMKPGARFINTARGGLVNEDALVERLKKGDISAYLDVTDPEPPPAGHPFYTLPNCFLTPHIAGSLSREVEFVGDYVVRELENYLSGRPLEAEYDLGLFDVRA